MSEERSEVHEDHDRAGDNESPANDEEYDSALECPAAPRIGTIELPPNEDDNMISGPSGGDGELPEALLLSDYGYVELR